MLRTLVRILMILIRMMGMLRMLLLDMDLVRVLLRLSHVVIHAHVVMIIVVVSVGSTHPRIVYMIDIDNIHMVILSVGVGAERGSADTHAGWSYHPALWHHSRRTHNSRVLLLLLLLLHLAGGVLSRLA